MIKPKAIEVVGEDLLVRGPLLKRRVSLRELTAIRVQKVLSLADEVGVTLVGDQDIFFTDSEPWFLEVARDLDFESKFGPEWYSRAESGELLEFQGAFVCAP